VHPLTLGSDSKTGISYPQNGKRASTAGPFAQTCALFCASTFRRFTGFREGVKVHEGQIISGSEVSVTGEQARWVVLSTGFFGGLDGNVAVGRQPGTSGDELSDDDVLFETDQRITLALHGSFGKNPGGLLEGSRREPGLCCQGSLGNSHDFLTSRCRLFCLHLELLG